MDKVTPQERRRMNGFRRTPEASHTLTLSPQMLFLQHPITTAFAHQNQYLDTKPMRWESVSFDHIRRSSVASSTSTSSTFSCQRHSASPASSPMESKGSPASSTSAYSSHQAEEPRPDISQMSAAPFSNSFSGIFGLTTECLACGYRYDTVDQLADHQRIEHGLADVIF